MQLHVGCGKRYLSGWVNADVQAIAGCRAPDLLCAADKIPLPDGAVSTLMSIHVWEHFYRWECDDVIKEWRRLLKPGGALILELPNAIKCAANLIKLFKSGGKPLQQLAMWGLFGDETLKDPHMCHRWGWWPESLIGYLLANGFTGAREEPTQWHPAGRDKRDMRIVAVRSK